MTVDTGSSLPPEDPSTLFFVPVGDIDLSDDDYQPNAPAPFADTFYRHNGQWVYGYADERMVLCRRESQPSLVDLCRAFPVVRKLTDAYCRHIIDQYEGDEDRARGIPLYRRCEAALDSIRGDQ